MSERTEKAGVFSECPACGDADLRVAYRLAGYSVIRCAGCGLHAVDVPYDEREIKEMEYYWAENIYQEEEASIRKWVAAEMDRVTRLSPPGRLLDVGCSFGYLLEEAKSRGWDVSGVEISRKVYEKYLGGRARELNVYNGRLEDAQYEPESFDAVTMFDVIEHLAAPDATLCEVRRVLRTGGLLALETPREESLFKKAAHILYHLTGGSMSLLILGTYNPHPGGHRFGFTRRAMEKMLSKCGFETVKTEKRMMPFRMFARSALGGVRSNPIIKLIYAGFGVSLWVASAALGMQNRMVIYARKTGDR